MTGRIETFADLLAPVRSETFFQQNWENEPLHIQRSESSFYESLLTNRDVESAISSGGLRYPAIQLARGGGFFPEKRSLEISGRAVTFSTGYRISIVFVPNINPAPRFRCQLFTARGSLSARWSPLLRRVRPRCAH